MIWIKMYKKLKDWEWFTDINVTYLWIYLLLTASDEDKRWQGMVVRKGQMVTSVSKLASATGLTDKQIRRCIGCLERTGEIVVERANKWSIITICKYDDYQVSDNQEGQAEVTQNAEPRGRQRATSKDIKILDIKERVSKDTLKKSEDDLIDQCIAIWNKTCTRCPAIRPKLFSERRKTSLLLRLKDMGKVGVPLEVYKLVCDKISASDFIANGSWCTIDWLVKSDENWRKVYNGNFDNKQPSAPVKGEDINELW